MHLRLLFMVWVIALLTCSSAGALQAEVVGRFIQVEGQVEVVRQGRGPAAAKVQDGVATWDLIQTRANSRAQVRFVDDSVATIAPNSSIVVQEYLYDAPRGTRRAVLKVFRGLAYLAVDRILTTREPDFIVKTITAVLGVRGTRFFVLPGADFTCAFSEAGLLEAGNVLPAITKKTLLKGMEYCFIKTGQEPTTPLTITPKQLARLKQWLQRGVPPQVYPGDPQQIFASGHPWPE